ncbi:alpha-1,2-mannosidase, putative [Arachidicoccus rhizosphaerae]|uniref:Alpha-1,2-mannosidase, putative n=1 Tax=Arachidicoccus rhizosphaerae TaxID=551991 RepID=A0A1H4D3G3_9BACT|nr:GH92 family glycosyl hydrolase [Arachidicoccus rhizosphaerae]SEA67060.1 alpha-1,2-mannosidase, putative [Arachidicoccus rhizosphaerae]
MIKSTVKGRRVLVLSTAIAITMTQLQAQTIPTDQTLPLVKYVKPIIGTERMGHTFPGATVPFGAVQLSPETDTIPYSVDGKYVPDVYKYCAGYQYDDATIVGFAHTHFNGTGHSDLGDFLIMPTVGKLQLNPGTAADPASGFRSRFSHTTEQAAANYYKVDLEDYHIKAELTTTTRVGMHKYTFPATDSAHIILDMMYNLYNYPGKDVWTYLRIINDSTVVGYRQTNGWAKNRTEYFAMQFSKPFKSYGYKNYSTTEPYIGFWRRFDMRKNFPLIQGHDIRAYFDFDAKAGESIEIKMALSPVSYQGALDNMQEEARGWDFNQIKNAGQLAWEKELEKVKIETLNDSDKVNFYTAMYHSFINPTIYMDVDGNYKGLDQQIHNANDSHFTNYTTFSLWDTHRALHPLFTLLQPKRAGDMVESMLKHFDQSIIHMLPVWSTYANEGWCMTGYHAVSVIADAIAKNINGFDQQKALQAVITTATNPLYDNIPAYEKYGYIPDSLSGTSVSTTLEYAYDDWCIAQMAKKLGNDSIYEQFSKRAMNYKNVYDPSIGYMRPKDKNGVFRKNFDPLETSGEGFIEGNAWNYTLYVPHDPKGLIQLTGGDKAFIKRLDALFTTYLPDKYFEHTEDITRDGLIGNYVHGNEPSHHIAYLYNWTSEPWKTQSTVRMILKSQYHNGPDGLGGNDDTGQMSAWYIFSALGFYPVAPGSDLYNLGSPLVKSATIQLENGKTFAIKVVGQSEQNVYVSKVELDGKTLSDKTISQSDITSGGNLTFYMSNKHKK